MLEESVPQVSRKYGIDPGQDREKMGFERRDFSFSGIAAVEMGRVELVPCILGFSDGLLIGRTDLILQYLEVYLMAAAC